MFSTSSFNHERKMHQRTKFMAQFRECEKEEDKEEEEARKR